ncbi:MAG: hypothetical protein M1830_001552 [Pleopsidium flavum]|nr:MAG: hypothetical protein M1830_001552 [Pleopsidium flavum]
MARAIGPRSIQHGHHIFVYNNIRTNQVVYSLTRAMNNNASLRQLPYLGKKTVPAALRKDLWLPLASISFPSSSQGLTAFRKLREFRKLHETAYSLELITQTEGKHKGTLLGKKKRGKKLMDQKANSVADIAAVLLKQEDAPKPAEKVVAKRNVAKRKKGTRGSPPAKKDDGAQTVTEAQGVGSTEGVRIRWANILDAQFAETWPVSVVHDDLRKDRYAAADPTIVAEVPADVSKGDVPETVAGS